MTTRHHATQPTGSAESGAQTQNNSIHRKWSAPALGGFLFISIFALSPPPVKAQCKQWDVSGSWGMQQSNGYTTRVNLSQDGKRISGTTSYRGKTQGPVSSAIEKVNPVTGKFLGEVEPGTTTTHKGAISGSIEGNVFYAEISWEGGGGIYNGKVGPDGRISGSTYDRNKPSSKANWSSTIAMKCADAAPVKPSSGPVRPPGPDWKKLQDEVNKASATQSGNAKPAEAGATPTLVANPQTVQIPAGQNVASTTVSWSIGTGRPIIVLRVKDEDGVSTDLKTLPSVPGPGFVSQPTGSVTVPVKPGKNVFSLSQSGKRLAMVTVTGMSPSANPGNGTGGSNPGSPDRGKPGTSTSAPSAPTSTTTPRISARPTVVTIPDGQAEGSTTLTWDGGSEHPYAEVWVAVDGGDPAFVVELGKGSRRVTVEPGRTYRYILTDSGKDLSTVTVRGQ